MEFVFPCERVLDSYREAYAEDIAVNKGELQMLIHPDIAIARSESDRKGEGLPAGYVPATTLWLVDGDRFIGRVNNRHRLSPSLLRFGGHIGYTIRPSEQGKGYGKLQLAMALDYCREHFGFEKVLVTCDDTNIRSAKTIEANGGVLQDKIENEIEPGVYALTRRYWIEL